MINFPYSSKITANDVLTYGGYRLEDRLAMDDGPNMSEVASRFLLIIAGHIYDAITKLKGKATADMIYASTDAEVVDFLKRCQLYQAIYIFENGDISSDNGVKTLIHIDELRENRNLDPRVIVELKQAGLYYQGVM